MVCGQLPGGYNMNSVNKISWHRRWPTKGLIPSGVVPRPEKYDGPALLVLAPDSQEPEPLMVAMVACVLPNFEWSLDVTCGLQAFMIFHVDSMKYSGCWGAFFYGDKVVQPPAFLDLRSLILILGPRNLCFRGYRISGVTDHKLHSTGLLDMQVSHATCLVAKVCKRQRNQRPVLHYHGGCWSLKCEFERKSKFHGVPEDWQFLDVFTSNPSCFWQVASGAGSHYNMMQVVVGRVGLQPTGIANRSM